MSNFQDPTGPGTTFHRKTSDENTKWLLQAQQSSLLHVFVHFLGLDRAQNTTDVSDLPQVDFHFYKMSDEVAINEWGIRVD